MAAAATTGTLSKPFYYFPRPRPSSLLFPLPAKYQLNAQRRRTRRAQLAVCFVLDETRREELAGENEEEEENIGGSSLDKNGGKLNVVIPARVAERLARKKSERGTYLAAAVMSSLGITFMAAMAVYYRFYWQMEGGEVPLTEIFGTFALSIGAAVGMEFWARWAHKSLWHASLWDMHESHHKPREGPFELNDVFAIANAIPAIALLSYGFFNKGLIPGLCFGAGLGITVFGMAYMFVHDGLVHKRFPVGPIANVPYFRKVAAAHQLHHSEKFNGVPYGLFLGPKVGSNYALDDTFKFVKLHLETKVRKLWFVVGVVQELEEVGGLEELEKEIDRRKKIK